MRRVRWLLIPVLCAPSAWGQEEDSPSEQLKVRDRVYTVYPNEELRQRGMEVPEVPFEQNAAWKYVEAINAMVDPPQDLRDAFVSARQGNWPDGEAGERLASWLIDMQPALDLFRQASDMPDYHMPLCRGNSDSLIAAILPSISEMRQLSKSLAVEATFLMKQGKATDALDNYMAVQRVANHVARGQTLIEGLVGIATRNLASEGLMRVSESGLVDSETLKEAIDEMDRLAVAMPTFEELVRAEQRFCLSTVDDVMDFTGAIDVVTGGSVSGLEGSPRNGWTRLRGALMRLYLPDRAMKRNFNRHYDAVVEATRPTKAGVPGGIIEEQKLVEQVPAWDIVTKMMLPSLARVHELTRRGESNFIRSRLKMATEAYHLDHGKHPDRLSSLVPEYISKVPADPMTGYDFEYRPSGQGKLPQGLAIITRENAKELRKKRRTPEILNPRASMWRQYTRDFVNQYQLTDRQRVAAESVLRDLEARAADFERTHGVKIRELMEKGDTDAAARRMEPIDKLFVELKKRLDALPTAKQRAAVKAKNKAGEGNAR